MSVLIYLNTKFFEKGYDIQFGKPLMHKNIVLKFLNSNVNIPIVRNSDDKVKATHSKINLKFQTA